MVKYAVYTEIKCKTNFLLQNADEQKRISAHLEIQNQTPENYYQRS